MFKKIFYQGILAAFLSIVACMIYKRIYLFSTEIDFSNVITLARIISINLMICILASFLYWFSLVSFKARGEVIFNFLFSIISFSMVMIPISISLPLKIKNPELFPGLAVPMVFFPALAWYTVGPLFKPKILV